MRRLFRFLVRLAFVLVIEVAYRAYKAEGVNALLLIIPARMIVPTLRRYGATIGEAVEIHSPLIIHNASPQAGQHYSNLVIHDHCYLGRDVFLDLKDKITLEAYVTISMRCTLITHTDTGERPPELVTLSPSAGPIHLKKGVYLGACVTVLEGVTIGEKAVVAAGAVVTSDVSAQDTVGGVPARLIRGRE